MYGASSADHAQSGAPVAADRPGGNGGAGVGRGQGLNTGGRLVPPVSPQPCPVPAVLLRSAGARGAGGRHAGRRAVSTEVATGGRGGDVGGRRTRVHQAVEAAVRPPKRRCAGVSEWPHRNDGRRDGDSCIGCRGCRVVGARHGCLLRARHDRAGRLVSLLHGHGRRVAARHGDRVHSALVQRRADSASRVSPVRIWQDTAGYGTPRPTAEGPTPHHPQSCDRRGCGHNPLD